VTSRARRGEAWENLLDAVHDRYIGENRAWVVRTPPRFRVIKRTKGGQFIGVYQKQDGGPPDYTAFSRGLCFGFDAKDCAGDRWPLSNLKDHQAKAFNLLNLHGGMAFILLRFRGDGYLVPWTDWSGTPIEHTLAFRWHRWKNKLPGAAASLSARDLRSHAHKFVAPDFDWLAVAMRARLRLD